MSELIETYRTAAGVEFLVLRGELGGNVLWDIGYSGDQEGWDSFLEDFEVDSTDYLGDPSDSHYQGTTFTRLIKRRSDGAVFGASYWWNPGIDSIEGEAVGQPDLSAIGVSYDWEADEPEPVVFVPVKRFERIGYELDNPWPES